MRFASPSLLLWWGLLPVLAILVGVSLARQRALLGRLGRHATVGRLARTASLQRRVSKALIALAALALVTLAMARPQWGRVVEPVSRRGVDVVLALDVSQSMHARDVTPDRFTRAKALANDLARRLEGNRVGLVAFSATAFVQCPLTLDRSAVQLFLDILEVGDVPDPGSNLEEAIRVAMNAFPEEQSGRRVIVLITDGEDLDGRAQQAAKEARDSGILLYTMGVGTVNGGPIPVAATNRRLAEYKKDGAGKVITTRLAPEHLQAVALAGGGRAMVAGAALGEAESLATEIDALEKADLSSRMVSHHKERYQWPLAAAIALLLLEVGIAPSRRLREEP